MKPVVVFVDDEVNVLRGLRRFTRPKRGEWDMHFIAGGRAAIDLMQQTKIDVVVSDMRMPDVSGADLLEHISQKDPTIIRLILSGEAERGQTCRTVGRSHRFLAKPCEPDQLISAINAPLAMRAKLKETQAVKSSSIYDQLQSPKSVFNELETLLTDETPSIKKIIALIKTDLNLAIRVLQLANSAYFGRPHVTCSIKKAVQVIGIENLHDLFIMKRLGNAEQVKNTDANLSPLWQSACQLANKAAHMAHQRGADEALIEEVYSAGLFSSLGSFHRKEAAETKPYFFPLGAAYVTTLLGLPPSLSQTFLSMSDLNGDATQTDLSNYICNAMVGMTQ